MKNRFSLILTIFISIYMSYSSQAHALTQIPTKTAATPLIPRQVLFGNPDKVNVSSSYDGKYITYIAPKDGVLNIWLAPINDISKAKPITNDTERGIRNYSWAYNSNNVLYSQDAKGDENFHIYSYNVTTHETKLLTPESGVRAHITGKSYKFPDHLLISTNERDKKYFDVYKINLLNSTSELLMKNERFTGFVVDNDLQIRFGKINYKEGGDEYFELKQGEWLPFCQISMEDSSNTYFLGFDNTGNILYLQDSRGQNTAALKALNLTTGKFTTIAEDNKADISGIISHPTDRTIQAVVIDYDRMSYKILDELIRDDIEYLAPLSRGNLIINTRTLDDSTWLVAYENDNSPVKYYKYDRLKKKAEFLFTNRKELESYSLATMYPVIIKSRDGLNLVSYITYPEDVKTELPLIIYVHGGPWVRDNWGYDPVHQWLANRGYAVLSINYRGSTGFGKNFVNASNLEWGRKMHEDLIDGVNWAIENKIADPKKVAIMGGSYGGYATLVGMTMTPDIFACGVDVVGPSNLLTLIKSVPPYWEPILNNFKKRVGAWDTAEEIEFLNQRSPLTFVDNIKNPLFIAQGAHDPRVKQAESDQLVKAMQAKNIPVIYALYEDEGHGFVRSENRLSYYALVEHFLAKILGGLAEPIGDDLNGAKLILNEQKNLKSEEAKKIIEESIK